MPERHNASITWKKLFTVKKQSQLLRSKRRTNFHSLNPNQIKKLPLAVGGLFILGLLTLGFYQLISNVNNSLANLHPATFSDVGNADWCSSPLQVNLNSTLFTSRLGSDLNYLAPHDCGDKISLISQADWLAYGGVYQSSLGTAAYLPTGVTNVWTTTSVGDPASKQVYQIDPTGNLNPADSDTLADFIPTVKLASNTICVSGSGTTSDPFILANDSLCNPAPSPTPTPTTTVCSSGYHLRDGSCRPNCNATACINCSSPNYCSECEAGYILNGGRCIPECDVANCSACSTPNYCYVCVPGYSSISGWCQSTTKPPNYRPTPVPSTPTPPIVVAISNPSDHGLTADSMPACSGDRGFLPDLYSLACLAGASEMLVKSIANLGNYLFSVILMILGLPLALILAVFPLPRGKVLANASVAVDQDGHHLASRFADRSGYYYGFHLPVAEYSLRASKKGTPALPAVTLINNSYHHNLYPDFTSGIPDRAPAASLILRFTNHLANAASIIFIITLLLTFTYLTLPGVLASLAHLPWMIRRVKLGVEARDLAIRASYNHD